MCIHNSIYAQLKAWANSFIIERQQGSAQRSFLLKILTTHKKSKQTSILAGQKHATFYTLVWARTFDPVNQQLWMKSSKFTGKIKQIRAKWTQKNVFKSKTPSYHGFWLFKIIFTLPTNLRNVQLTSFFRLYLCCSLDQDLKVNGDREIGQFFAGFFHISKRRKTALQLNRDGNSEARQYNALSIGWRA